VQHGEGGPIYLHQLDDTAGSLFDAPEAVEYYKTTVENVRMKVRRDWMSVWYYLIRKYSLKTMVRRFRNISLFST
jgi:hypothetical protein